MQDRNRCERKYHYKWIEEIDPTFAAGSVSMRQGTLAHYGLQAGYEWIKWFQQQSFDGKPLHYADGKEAFEGQFIDVALQAMAKMVASGISIYRGEEQPLGLTPEKHFEEIRAIGDSVQFYARHKIWYDFQHYKILATEVPFDYPFTTYNGEDVILSGVFDLLAQDVTHEKNVVVVMDHKTVGDVNNTMSFLPLDVQMLSYEALCWRALGQPSSNGGYDDVEVIYNMIRREVPPGFGHRSEFTPTGKKSTASRNVDDYLKRTSLWHSTKEREAIESNFLIPMLSETAESQYYKGPLIPRIIRTGGEACSSCDFFARCKANILGRGQPRFVHV